MSQTAPPLAAASGRFTFPGTGIGVNRMGYGAMQLAGPHVFGPPKDETAAIAVLREAVKLGVDHVDTSDFYGPHVTNRIIRTALYPYTGVTLVTKLGARRDDAGNWLPDLGPDGLTRGIEDNLRNLDVGHIDIVNLRIMDPDSDIAGPVATMRRLQDQGLIRHIGLSNVTKSQVVAARDLVSVVCVQNHYNLAHRGDDALIDFLAEQGIAYVPFFPLGGFSPLQSEILSDVAAELKIAPMQAALAWLLRRAPNILLIPGTSSIGHLRENIASASLTLPEAVSARLNRIGG